VTRAGLRFGGADLCGRHTDAVRGLAGHAVAAEFDRPGVGPQASSRRYASPLVESALLLATLRRLARSAELPPLPKIRSLAYFLPVIEELQQQPLPNGYLDYLRLKLRKLSRDDRLGVQKNTFLEDR